MVLFLAHFKSNVSFGNRFSLFFIHTTGTTHAYFSCSTHFTCTSSAFWCCSVSENRNRFLQYLLEIKGGGEIGQKGGLSVPSPKKNNSCMRSMPMLFALISHMN